MNKVELKCEADWVKLLDRSGCVQSTTGGSTTSSTANSDAAVSIDLEKFLRYCFDIAYKMPASPNTRPKTAEHVRIVSHGGVPLAGSGGGGRRNPPELSV